MFTIPCVSCVTCHMSRVTCHVSRVTCHVSHVTRPKKRKNKKWKQWWSSSVEGLLSTGLPRLVLVKPHFHQEYVTVFLSLSVTPNIYNIMWSKNTQALDWGIFPFIVLFHQLFSMAVKLLAGNRQQLAALPDTLLYNVIHYTLHYT